MSSVFIKLSVVVLVGCGESSDICFGPYGTFIASPQLSVNNCLNPPLFSRQIIYIGENSQLRTCGWHDIDKNITKSNNCVNTLKKSLHTTGNNNYRGFIILDIRCSNRSCTSIWELEFVKGIEEDGKS